MTIDDYVRDVMRRIPDDNPNRTGIEADLRAHLTASIDDGHSVDDAISRMGTPDEVAAGFTEGQAVVLASPLRRLAAFLVDLALLGVIAMIPLIAYLAMTTTFDPSSILGDTFWSVALIFGVVAVAALFAMLYFPVLEMRSGQTIGKQWLGLRVVRMNGGRVGFWRAVARRIPVYTQLPFLYIADGIFAFFTEQRQRAFDRVAETKVIRVRARHVGLAWLTVVCCVSLGFLLLQEWHRVTQPPTGAKFPPLFGQDGALCAPRVLTPDGRDTLQLLGADWIKLTDYNWGVAKKTTTYGRGMYVTSSGASSSRRIRLDCRSYTALPGQRWP